MNEDDRADASAMPKNAPGDESVGHGKPPKRSRFKPGQSGNRRGRPKGVKNRKTIIAEIAGEIHWVAENGKRKQYSTLELVVLAFRQFAAQTTRARVLRTYDEFDQKFGQPDPMQGGGYVIIPETVSDEEWEARFSPGGSESSIGPPPK